MKLMTSVMMNMVNPMTLLVTHLAAPQKEIKGLVNERKRKVKSTSVLSKQIKIVSQLNAKQINDLISDRNTIKAHGLQDNMTYYDSFSSDLVDIVSSTRSELNES